MGFDVFLFLHVHGMYTYTVPFLREWLTSITGTHKIPEYYLRDKVGTVIWLKYFSVFIIAPITLMQYLCCNLLITVTLKLTCYILLTTPSVYDNTNFCL